MDKQNLARMLLQINAWWNGLPVPVTIKKAETQRKQFHEVIKAIDAKRIVAITGPRQVGKTTIMGQMIDHQIKNGVIAKRIMYIPVDNTILRHFAAPEDVLFASVGIYSELILQEDLSNPAAPVFIYIDEIQDLENWAKAIKSYYDIYPNVHFVITGSSHTLLQKGIWESLVGRIKIRTLLPLKFSEFLTFEHQEMPSLDKDMEMYTIWPIRKSLKASLRDGNPQQFEQTLVNAERRLSRQRPMIKSSLSNYLMRGGFPHSILSPTLAEAGQTLKQDLELTVYKDIHRLFQIRDPSKLMDILTIIAKNTGSPVSLNNLGKMTESEWRTIDNAIWYFQQIFLTIRATPFGDDGIRSTKKDVLHINDTGILNVLLSQMTESTLIECKQMLYTTGLAAHVARLKLNLSEYQDGNIYFWNSRETDDYIDFVIDKPAIMPIALCIDEQQLEKKKKGMLRFMEKHSCAMGIIITEDTIKRDDKIIFMPFWMFMLIC